MVELGIWGGVNLYGDFIGVVIRGNTIQLNQFNGIWADGVLTNAVISDNTILNNSSSGADINQGIQIVKAYANITMSGNQVNDTRTPKLQSRGLYAPNGGTGVVFGNDLSGNLHDSIPGNPTP